MRTHNLRYFLILALLIVAVTSYFFLGDTKESSANTLSIATMGEPKSLDPNRVDSSWERIIIEDLYTGLVERDARGGIQKGMASSWDISPDGKIYTFHLRDSKWSDGTPVTAHDFEYSFKRILRPELAATYASIFYVIKNAQGYNGGTLSEDKVGVKAIDEKTLQVVLENPTSYFINMLAHFSFYPVPKHVVEKHGNSWSKPGNIVTNGAYVANGWKPNSYVSAHKNPYFWDAQNTKIENVIYYTQQDRSAVLKRFRSKEIDIVDDFSSDQYEWIMENLKDEVHVTPILGTYYYTVNVSGLQGTTQLQKKLRKLLQNQEVRQALSMAIDREFITEKVLKSGEVPAYSFVPKGMQGYIPYELSWKNVPYDKRVMEASRIMLKFGYSEKNPLALVISYDTSENDKKIAIAIADMWKSIGVVATLFNTEVNIHYANLQSQNFDVGKARWLADYDEPSNFLDLKEPSSAFNYGKYNSLAYNKLLADAKKNVGVATRYRLYKKAEEMMLNNASEIPIYNTVSKSLVSRRVMGWKANSTNTHLSRFLSLK